VERGHVTAVNSSEEVRMLTFVGTTSLVGFVVPRNVAESAFLNNFVRLRGHKVRYMPGAEQFGKLHVPKLLTRVRRYKRSLRKP